MTSYRAWRVPEAGGEADGGVTSLALEELSEGELRVRVAYSALNYKDALAVTGRGKILRQFPMTPGVDAAGVVEASASAAVAAGDEVVVTGCGLGEARDGGFGAYIRVPADWAVPLPERYTSREAMALGTAGVTAVLALTRMEAAGQHPALGEIVVTGASGGVGSIAVAIFARAGYRVIAATGKPEAAEWLRGWGAAEVVAPEELALSDRPLDRARYGGVVDNVGGALLGRLLPRVREYGNVASIGLAGGVELEATVMPFILRGVSLLGISSANCPRDLRLQAWRRLGAELGPHEAEALIAREIELGALWEASHALLERRAKGRTLVRPTG